MNLQEHAKLMATPSVDMFSSSRDIKDFQRSFVWKDIQSLLMRSLENFRDELETMGPGTGYTPEEIPSAMAFYQGQAFMTRIILDLPELLLTLKQEDENVEAE
jgi:hypothetical protein